MPLTTDPGELYDAGTEFSWYGRVIKFTEEDSSPEHKDRIGANPETYVGQLVLEIEGVSVEWLGEFGNRRLYTADLYNADGSQKKGRGGRAKWSALLASIIAPTDVAAALKAGFRKRGPDGKTWVGAPGMGYSASAPDFPECLEGHIFYIENRRIQFGTNRLTGEDIVSNIPALVRREDDYVHEGTVPQITYGGGATVAPDEEPGMPGAVETPPPSVFFAAIDGVRNDFNALHEAMVNAGVDCEPYRTLALQRDSNNGLVAKGLIAVGPDKTIAVTVDPMLSTVEQLKELVA